MTRPGRRCLNPESMRKLLILAAALLSAACAEAPQPEINVIPRPLSVEQGDGAFRLGRSCPIGYDDPALQSVAALCAGYLTEEGERKPVVADKPVHKGIDLQLDDTLAGEEYTLSATKKGVSICGGSPRAVLYGVQTLRQLIDGDRVPVVEIRDEPYFGYRGAMFDVARYFYPVEEVKRFIDIMALHKLNTFHWHLTDDQGWRIEIKRYPELTRIGSQRRETLIGHYKTSDEYDGKPHGGYYTQDEIREVVAYAAERCIDIIPEIELPGTRWRPSRRIRGWDARKVPTRCARRGITAATCSAQAAKRPSNFSKTCLRRCSDSSPRSTSTSAATNAPRCGGRRAPTVSAACAGRGWQTKTPFKAISCAASRSGSTPTAAK